MNLVSIRHLKRLASPIPVDARLHVRLENLAIKETRQGKNYLELSLADGMDNHKVRVWSDHALHPRASALRVGECLELAGSWQEGNFGLEPVQWDFRPLREEERDDLLLGPADIRARQTADFAFIEETANGLADPRLRALCQRFLLHYGERFRRTAAAREYHHARRGGLVEHVAQMMRSASVLAEVYAYVNRDLLLAGVLFHDCGKLWENCFAKDGFTMPHTEVSELMSHIPLGMEIANRLWREMMATEEAVFFADLQPANDHVRLHLLHLIASHHGTLEFGSPVLPKTPEAMLLHFVDNIDAKLEMVREVYDKSPQIAKNIFERMRPLWHSAVAPLPSYAPPVEGELAQQGGEEPAPEDAGAGQYEIR